MAVVIVFLLAIAILVVLTIAIALVCRKRKATGESKETERQAPHSSTNVCTSPIAVLLLVELVDVTTIIFT